MFFYSHWALHWPPLYSRIHKIHHQFKAPIPLAATYAHPLEVFLANALPLAVGPILMKSHIFTTWLWFIVAILGTQFHHGGYRFFFMPEYWMQPDFHDLHHAQFNVNFGLMGWLDKLHGTFRTLENTQKEK